MGRSTQYAGIVRLPARRFRAKPLGPDRLGSFFRRLSGTIGCLALLASACTTPDFAGRESSTPDYDWQLPPGFLPPPVPVANPVTEAKVELGRNLFYDERLSVNGQGSCATCHQQELAFTDGRARAKGVTGELHDRSSMSLINVAYNLDYTWASEDLQTLEQQILIPLFGSEPIELGMGGRESLLVDELNADAIIALQFRSAFSADEDPVSIENMVKALATFVRTIIAADSAFDRLLYRDDRGAMSASSTRGMNLFFSEELGCSQCHRGENFAGGQFVAGVARSLAEFHNTGLYNIGGSNRYPSIDSGLRITSGEEADDGKFRAPSLRNIALTAPYMHDGSIATLSAVIDHYAAGGRTIDSGPNAGAGRRNRNKSALLTGFHVSESERSDLLNFLESLTDYSVLEDPRFARPAINQQ